MPELPEVTVIVNGLNKKLKGLVLRSIEYDWPKKFYWNGFSIKDLKGARIIGVRRLGKVVVIDLVTRPLGHWVARKKKNPSNQVTQKPRNLSILIHLKLTGQLIYEHQDKQSLRSSTSSAGLRKTRIAGGHPIPPLNQPVPNKTTRVTFAFTNNGYLYFNDMRKFGWVKIVSSREDEVKKAIGMELGPDPLVMSYEQFRECLEKKKQGRIKKTLMDQSVIAGVGNIYSDEALWRAKIHPKRSIISLSDAEFKALYKGLRESLQISIEKGGSSANSFVDSGGERGLYLSFGKAYHMTGKPCARCKTPIKREKMDGRSAHFCPSCQILK